MRHFAFDLDGVLIRTEHLWRLAYPAAFRDLFGAVPDPPLDMSSVQGHRYTEVARSYLDHARTVLPDLLEETDDRFASAVLSTMHDLVSTKAEPISGSIEFVRRLVAVGVTPALASSSPRSLVLHELEAVGLADVFRPVVTGDDVSRSKPDPEIYETLARLVGAVPAEFVAVEDSPAGVAAALAAGMRCIMLKSADSPSVPWATAIECDALVSDLRLVDPQLYLGD